MARLPNKMADWRDRGRHRRRDDRSADGKVPRAIADGPAILGDATERGLQRATILLRTAKFNKISDVTQIVHLVDNLSNGWRNQGGDASRNKRRRLASLPRVIRRSGGGAPHWQMGFV